MSMFEAAQAKEADERKLMRTPVGRELDRVRTDLFAAQDEIKRLRDLLFRFREYVLNNDGYSHLDPIWAEVADSVPSND
jgi:hypothetical protein